MMKCLIDEILAYLAVLTQRLLRCNGLIPVLLLGELSISSSSAYGQHDAEQVPARRAGLAQGEYYFAERRQRRAGQAQGAARRAARAAAGADDGSAQAPSRRNPMASRTRPARAIRCGAGARCCEPARRWRCWSRWPTRSGSCSRG